MRGLTLSFAVAIAASSVAQTGYTLSLGQAWAAGSGEIVGMDSGWATPYFWPMSPGAASIPAVSPAGLSPVIVTGIHRGLHVGTAGSAPSQAFVADMSGFTQFLQPVGRRSGAACIHNGWIGGHVDERPVVWSSPNASPFYLTPWSRRDVGTVLSVIHPEAGGFTMPWGSPERAAVWNLNSFRLTVLHPIKYYESRVTAVNGEGTQAGYVRPFQAGSTQAVLWKGSAASMVILHPSWAEASSVWGAQGGRQVGGTYSPTRGTRAALWHGSAASYVDLHALLPSGFYASWAYGIDQDTGAIVGVATASSGMYAVYWK